MTAATTILAGRQAGRQAGKFFSAEVPPITNAM